MASDACPIWLGIAMSTLGSLVAYAIALATGFTPDLLFRLPSIDISAFLAARSAKVRATPTSIIAGTEAFAFPKTGPTHKRRRPRILWKVNVAMAMPELAHPDCLDSAALDREFVGHVCVPLPMWSSRKPSIVYPVVYAQR